MQQDETMNVDGVRVRVKITQQAKKEVAEFTIEGIIPKPVVDLTEEDTNGFLQVAVMLRSGLQRLGYMVPDNAAITEPGGSE
jgi:hypothetical protein